MASASVMPNHHSPEQSNKSGTHSQPRRRIQVACLRCRKRKIRCSGDTGNGQGCTNCKSSGTSGCIFVRVNSSLLQPGSWPYVLKSADSPPNKVRRGSWESQTYSRVNSVSMHLVSQMSSDSSPVSPSDIEYGATSQSLIYHRGSYSSGYPLAYEDTTMTYGMQAPSYMIPNGDTSAVSNLYGTQTNLRSWHPASQALKSSSAPLYCDQDTPASLGYSFASTTPSQTPVSAGSGSMLGVLTGLSSGLGEDRILPSPVASRNTSNNIFSTNIPDTLTALTSNGSQPQNYKISQLPSAECHLPSQDREDSRRNPKAHALGDDSSPDGKGTTVNPPRDIGFGYMQTVDMADSFPPPDSARPKKEDSLYSSETCTSSAYQFGSPTGKAPTLISGHAYTQLIHPQVSHNSAMFMRANAELAPVTETATSGLSSNGARQAY